MSAIGREALEALAARVGTSLARHGAMLATAESCTGGGIAEAVTSVAGSSAWFDRGFVTYSNAAKISMLGVSRETLERHGAVSEPTVSAMAVGALARSEAAVAVAVSGIAGPGGGTPDKPVGTVWLAWALRPGRVETQCLLLPGDRAEVRSATVARALERILELFP